jgi:transcriptional regulator with XRE-family HTH domain
MIGHRIFNAFSLCFYMVFVMRHLDHIPQTLGEKLRALRRGQAVSLAMMEKHTHIQKRYLEALERGRYDALPQPLYTRNFIKAYARLLGADETYFLELYTEESGQMDLLTPHRLPRQRVRRAWFFSSAKWLRVTVIAAFSFGIVSYFGWQVYGMIRPPSIVIDFPPDGVQATRALMEVTGRVENNDVELSINGRAVVVNDDKTFSTMIDLSLGVNVITVEGARRYSKTATEYRHVVFEGVHGETRGISLMNEEKE